MEIKRGGAGMYNIILTVVASIGGQGIFGWVGVCYFADPNQPMAGNKDWQVEH